MKWFFSPPFLSVSPFLLLNLVRRQCYAYAIGLYTRPEIKSLPDVEFFALAQCVLPRCPSFVHSFPNHVTKKRQALGTRMKRDPERPSRPSLPNQSSELSRLLAARAPRGLQLPCQQSSLQSAFLLKPSSSYLIQRDCKPRLSFLAASGFAARVLRFRGQELCKEK